MLFMKAIFLLGSVSIVLSQSTNIENNSTNVTLSKSSQKGTSIGYDYTQFLVSLILTMAVILMTSVVISLPLIAFYAIKDLKEINKSKKLDFFATYQNC